MFDFNKPNIEITDVSDDKKYGRFVVEPLKLWDSVQSGQQRLTMSVPQS